MRYWPLILLAAGCSSGPQAKEATFEARQEFQVTVPEGAKSVRLWMALPQEDSVSTIRNLKIESTVSHSVQKDSEGNRQLYVELKDPTVKSFTVVETFTIVRKEQVSGVDAKKAKPLSDADRAKMAKYLEANTHVVINDDIRKLSAEIVGSETNPVLAARRIYDWVLANIDYWVKDPNYKKASPVGSTEHCLTTKTGNCTDFHSLWTSLARAAGIPTRMVYGSFFKAELDGLDQDQSYHCWPEFYATGIGWIPHDVAVADIFVGDFQVNKDNDEKVRLTTADGYQGRDDGKVNYYFGNLDERRVTWSVGRDLTLSPKQDAGPVNAVPKAYMEADGRVVAEKTGWTRKLTFQEKK